MRPDFSSRGRSASPRWGNVLLGLGLAFAAWSAWTAWKAWSDRREARASLQRVQAPARAPRSAADDPVLVGAAQLQRGIAHPPAAVLSDLAAQLPGDARYSSVAVAYDTSVRLDLAVSARRPEAYDRVLETLARSAEIEQVLPGGETRSDEVNGRVRAAFRAPR